MDKKKQCLLSVGTKFIYVGITLNEIYLIYLYPLVSISFFLLQCKHSIAEKNSTGVQKGANFYCVLSKLYIYLVEEGEFNF